MPVPESATILALDEQFEIGVFDTLPTSPPTLAELPNVEMFPLTEQLDINTLDST